MEFSGFCPEGLDLMTENRLQNSKPFYEEHKAQIRELVQDPMCALAEYLLPTMLEIDPQFQTQPRKMLSRVRRDTRYTKDKTLYRDHIWISFVRPKGQFAERPGFYFEITPQSFGYGCGYYQAPAQEMQIAREMMLEGHPLFCKVLALQKQTKDFILYGEEYKRPRYPDAPPELQMWLNKKNIGLSKERTDFAHLFDGSFASELLADFQRIAPLYIFLRAVKDRAIKAQTVMNE